MMPESGLAHGHLMGGPGPRPAAGLSNPTAAAAASPQMRPNEGHLIPRKLDYSALGACKRHHHHQQQQQHSFLEVAVPTRDGGDFLGIIGSDPSVCNSHRLHVDILRFSFVKFGYIL